jgi:predicted ATPase
VAQFKHVAALDCSLDERRSTLTATSYDPVAAAHYYSGWARWCLGYPDDAVREIESGLRAAEEVGYRLGLANALTFASAVHCWRGDSEQLKACNERTLALAREEGFSYYIATGTFLDGLWLARNEQREHGLARMREGLDSLRAIEGRSTWRRFASEFAGQLALAGQLDEGLGIVAAEIEATGSDHFWDAELCRVRGELLLLRAGRADAAEGECCIQRAIDVARQQRAKSFELRAVTSLARVWHAQGRSQEAASRLSEIYGWFTEGFETADLREARRLLDTIGASVG